jgi:hypothetical protein
MSSQNEIDHQQQYQEPKGLLISKVESTGTRDAVYCQCLARRCVARAALHLGITTMDNESLDVLSACLLEYLSRIGEMTSHTAEAAGRTSAHCNVLDILNAVALCTSRNAVTVVQSASSDFYPELLDSMGGGAEQYRSSATGATGGLSDGYSSWKELAVFCFGPNWNESTTSSTNWTSDETSSTNQAEHVESVSSMAGGKVGPNSTMDPYHEETNNDGSRKGSLGWRAPFPEEVPAFPICGKQVANPHPLNPPSLHVSATCEDPDSVPESLYQISIESSKQNDVERDSKEAGTAGTKRKAADKEDFVTEGPASKKVKFSHPVNVEEPPDPSVPGQMNVSFFPTFYPPLPNLSKARAVQDFSSFRASKRPQESSIVSADSSSSQVSSTSLRSTLVGLGEYWGSRAEEDAPLQQVRVLPGRTAVPSTAGAPSIVPLGRASGSRVSRILEGSMDAAP